MITKHAVDSEALMLTYLLRRRNPAGYVQYIMEFPHFQLQPREIEFLDAIGNEKLAEYGMESMKDIPERLRGMFKEVA